MRLGDLDNLKEVINDMFRAGEYDCNSVLKAIDSAPTVSDYLVEIARKNFELGCSIGKSESEIVKNITIERMQKGDTELISRRDIKDHIGELLLVYSDEELANAILNAIDNAEAVDAYPFEQVQELVKLNQQFAEEIEELKKPQGEWITGGKDVTGQYFYDEFICNQCFTVVTDKSNFCPKCGAAMLKGSAE